MWMVEDTWYKNLQLFNGVYAQFSHIGYTQNKDL